MNQGGFTQATLIRSDGVHPLFPSAARNLQERNMNLRHNAKHAYKEFSPLNRHLQTLDLFLQGHRILPQYGIRNRIEEPQIRATKTRAPESRTKQICGKRLR